MKPTLPPLSATSARRTLAGGSLGLHQTIQRLSNLLPASATTMKEVPAAIRRAEQCSRHARDVLTFLRMMAGTLDEVSKLLDRAWSLSQQAQAITTTDLDRLSQDAAYQSVLASLQHLLANSTFNGERVLGPVTLKMQIEGPGQTVAFEDFNLGLNGEVKTPAGAHATTKAVHTARNRVAHRRTMLKGFVQSLDALASAQGVRAQTLASANSCLHDVYRADEIFNIAKLQGLSLTAGL